MRKLAMWSVLAMTASAQQGWWMTEPIRWVQTNLRQTDAALDARAAGGATGRHARQRAAAWGWAESSPTIRPRSNFTIRVRTCRAGRDMFGDVLREAHARKIRVVGRFDFSKTRKAVFDAHPGVVLPAGERRSR